MKRKCGNKKSKSKKHSETSNNENVQKISSDNAENSSGDADIDNDEVDSVKEVETTTVVEKDQPEKIADNNSSIVINKPAGNLVYGRMKVRIKTSKVLDSQATATDSTPTPNSTPNSTPTPTRSDTDISSQLVGPEKNETPTEKIEESEKIEENENLSADINTNVSPNPPKKFGSIKIKSSKNLGSAVLNPCTSSLAKNEETRPKEPGVVRAPRSNDLDLKAALEVIKKIMKMDAAEPFNAPVNPVALGIPDYFDVIDTPMDFGTICSNLESGDKYKTSEDVYKDLEYVWNNCYKYNKKGDYVVELMKRVKKNLIKYWMAAGLYIEQPQGSSGADVTQSQDGPHTSNMNMQGESQLKQKKRPGVKRHKDECLCAICKMMRRRQEREESLRGEENSYLVQEGHSPYQEISSNMENSSGPDADSEMEDKGAESRLDNIERQYTPVQGRVGNKEFDSEKFTRNFDILGYSQQGEGSGEGGEFPAQGNDFMLIDSPLERRKVLHDDRTPTVEQIKRKRLIDKKERAKMLEKLQQFENPLLLKLCGTLFTNNAKSVWSGPHSLINHQDRSRSSSIHEAISSFMK